MLIQGYAVAAVTKHVWPLVDRATRSLQNPPLLRSASRCKMPCQRFKPLHVQFCMPNPRHLSSNLVDVTGLKRLRTVGVWMQQCTASLYGAVSL